MTRMTARLSAALFWLSLCPAGAFAAVNDGYPPPWPEKDITITLPFSQGGEGDALFSLLREALVAKTGKNAVARYVPGRAGADAWSRIVDDAADGSVLTLVAFPDAYLRSTEPDSGVFLGAMALCNVVAFMPCVLWAAEPGTPGSVRELADIAAEKNGGFIVAGSGRYSATQLAARALDRETGTRTTYMPYTGSVAAAEAVVKGRAGAFWGYSVRVVSPGVKAGGLKPLAVAAGKRLPTLPDAPTFQELGMRIAQGVYLGLAAPASTPEITRQEITEFFSALAKTPAFQAKASALGFSPLDIDAESFPVFFAGMKGDAERQAESFSLSDQ